MRVSAASGRLNPRDAKERLGRELVTRFHDADAARVAADAFRSRFQRDELPQDLEPVRLACPAGGLPIANVLKESGLTSSTSEALRMLRQGAVRLDGERMEDPKRQLPTGTDVVLQIGKRRVARVVLEATPAEGVA